MAPTPDPLLEYLRQSLPVEIAALLRDHLDSLETGNYHTILPTPTAQDVVQYGHSGEDIATEPTKYACWTDHVFRRLGHLISQDKDPATPWLCFLLGYSCLLAFLQSNFTGPPLPFSSAKALFGEVLATDEKRLAEERRKLIDSLGVDGVAAYRLTPNIELLCLADAVFSCPSVKKRVPVCAWAQLRGAFIHQRILSESSSTLQEQIYGLLEEVQVLLQPHQSSSGLRTAGVEFLLEKASIETYYNNDKTARDEIGEASRQRHFDFALTGILGKRTKFQNRDISQLVVLAKSTEPDVAAGSQVVQGDGTSSQAAPKNLDLNDDTLLDNISFSKKTTDPAAVLDESSLPESLRSLNPADQPLLHPLDSVILLSLASAITNTSPADGLTREETLPYATRVLEGGSSNWQIYTQALLVRSRIEGYKSRTVERGLLQLQALVDEVTAATTQSTDTNGSDTAADQSTFLPRPQVGETGPAWERLRYIFQLASPARWDLEAELAQRWVQLGGLRSALDIYERLEMWAEAALCWAATDREDKAKAIIRKMLYYPTAGEGKETEDEKWTGPLRDPSPADAPRLFCILGDIDQDMAMYEKAWEVSGKHYARAQRSLGRHYFAKRDYLQAAAAYSKSLSVNKLNHGSWFALGCALLELDEFGRAAEAFTRCVQLDERDAEAWSNLAAALLKRQPEDLTSNPDQTTDPDDVAEQRPSTHDLVQKSKQEALRALKRAASLKHDSHKIWENVLIVASSLSPPDLPSAILAQSRIIDLLGPTVGEKCVDVEIMALLTRHVLSTSDGYDASKPGPERMLTELFDKKITPLITASAALWSSVAQLALWRGRPSSALEAHEKAWRVVTSQPGWEGDTEKRFEAVVDATVELCDAYESLGGRQTTEGLGAGSGALVAKDWRFKGRSAVRGILGRARDNWEGTEGWERLKGALEGLKGA